MAAALPFMALAASAGGPLIGGITSALSANYQSQVARNNAQIAGNNANYSASAGAAQTEQAGLRARAVGANTKASLAAQNVDVGTGSAADVQTSQAGLSRLETATVANRAAEQVYGYRTQELSYSAQAKADQAQILPDILGGVLGAAGGAAKAATDIPGVSSLLSGPSSAPANYAWMGQGATLPSSFDEEFNQGAAANGVFNASFGVGP